MNIILPFNKPIEAYNPADAITTSILSGYNDRDELINCLWQTFSFAFEENNNNYLDVHLWHQSAKISRKMVPRVILSKSTQVSICNFLVEALQNHYYIFLVLDRAKIKIFDNTTFFPHLVTIYGTDNINKEFYIADFDGTKGYVFLKIPFNEVNDAYHSIMDKIQNLPEAGIEYDWITNIELNKYNSNLCTTMREETIAEEIGIMLQSIYPANIDNLYNGNIARFNQTKFISVPIQNTLAGWNVFIELITHLKKAIKDDIFIIDRKHFYFFYAYTLLLKEKVDILSLIKPEGEENKILNLRKKVEKILSCYRICLNMGLKYLLNNQTEILERTITLLEENTLKLYYAICEFKEVLIEKRK